VDYFPAYYSGIISQAPIQGKYPSLLARKNIPASYPRKIFKPLFQE
jgi:hypothetical protein